MGIKKFCLPLLVMFLFLTVFSQTWEDDSLIVRQILDTNGLDTVLVDNIAKKKNGRINTLYFYNMPAFHILPVTIGELNTLTDLKICKTGIVTVPHEIGNFKLLRILHLYENKLISLPPEIGSLDSLRGMSINNNELTAIPPEIGNCKKLYTLRFGENKITRIPDEICDMVSLKSISAQSNLINYVPEEIGNMAVLGGINLEYNKLKYVPNSLIPLSLDDVKLCYNDSLMFTEEQKASWGVTDYNDFFWKYCPVEVEEDVVQKQSKNSQIHINPHAVLLRVDHSGHITCYVFNLCGRRIETLVNGVLSAGMHSVSWNRSHYAPGIYFVRYSAVEGHSFSRKVVVK